MNIYSLDNLPLNKDGYIIDLKSQGALRRRMLDLGLIKNTLIKPVFISPSGDPRAYEVRGSIIAIRKKDAELVNIKTKWWFWGDTFNLTFIL